MSDGIHRFRGPTKLSKGGFREIQLNDKDWGEIHLVMAIPRPGDFWGYFAPLKGSKWERLVKVVSGTAMSDAMHGYAVPLMRQLRRKPRDTLKIIPFIERRCRSAMDRTCLSANENCVPGTRVLPICYEAQIDDPEIRLVANQVAKWLDEGRYVVVVEGDEFSL